jgi:uncharacterized repeat protein (TIGR03803 family)
VKHVFAVVLLIAALQHPAEATAAKVQVLYKFKGGKDGIGPHTGLVADSAGNLYGTTQLGGGTYRCPHGCGTVFELSPPANGTGGWTETVLYRFSGQSDGAGPLGRLIFDGQGNLYGTTFAGGDFSNRTCRDPQGVIACGVVFELSPPAAPGGAWTETVLHSFEGSDGAFPNAGLTFDGSGNLYGATTDGGTPCGGPGCGVVFELSPPLQPGGQWSFVDLYDFTGGSDGQSSFSDLIFDASNNLYGTTCGGGDYGGGVVFELSPPLQQGGDWTEIMLTSFEVPGCPRAGVVFNSASDLFGTTSQGGTFGTVFELSPSSNGSWTLTTLYAFPDLNNAYPSGAPVFDRLGNLYGTVAGEGSSCGAIYRLIDQEGVWNEAQYSFSSQQTQPCGPSGALIFGENNALYGTSAEGGACGGVCGTVFGVLP